MSNKLSSLQRKTQRSLFLFFALAFSVAFTSPSLAFAQGSVDSLILVDADTDQDILTLSEGLVIDRASLPTNKLNVRATTSGSVGSVVFALDGNPNFRTESVAPYALAGDQSGDYLALMLSDGAHQVSATPFSSSGGNGTAGSTLSFSFSIVDSSNSSVSLTPATHDFGQQTVGSTSSHTFALANNSNTGTGGTYQEQGGVLVIEIEDHPSVPGWTEKTDIADFTGSAYLEWTGNNFFNNPGNGVLTFTFEIQTPGNYQLQWRNRIAQGTSFTDNNDSWVQFPTGVDVTGEEPLNGNWTKTYLNQLNTWSWQTRTVDNNPQDIRQFFSAGTHQIKVSARSNGHAIDRIVLYKYDTVSFNGSTFNNLTPSPQSGGSGGASVEITSVSFSGAGASDYSYVGPSTPFSIAAGANTPFDVEFSPSTPGARPATLSVGTNLASGPVTSLLQGSGITTTAPILNLSTSTLDFGTVDIVTPGFAEIELMIENTGTATLNLGTLSIDGAHPGDFSIRTLSSNVVPVGQTESAFIQFIPSQVGMREARLLIPSNASSSPDEVSLVGTGTMQAAGIEVISLNLIDADQDSLVQTLLDQDVINLESIQATSFSIQAITNPATVGSVVMSLSGPNSHNQTESISPYALFGDMTGDFIGEGLPVGQYTLTATPYTEAGGNGTAGTPLSLSFEIIDEVIAEGLTATPNSLDFGTSTLGAAPAPDQTFSLQNVGSEPVTVTSLAAFGVNGSDFVALNSLPFTLAAGESTVVTVNFSPSAAGAKSASLEVSSDASNNPSVTLTAFVLPESGGEEFVELNRFNVGGPLYVDGLGKAWNPVNAEFISAGKMLQYENIAPIDGTLDDTLFQSELFGNFDYVATVPNGEYRVTLLFTELYFTETNKRVFDVLIEGTTVLDDLDIFDEVGHLTALTQEFLVTVADGELNIEFRKIKNNAKLAGLLIEQKVTLNPTASLSVTPNSLTFLETNVSGATDSETLLLENTGSLDIQISSASVLGTHSADFSTGTVPMVIPVGGSEEVEVTFDPTDTGTRSASLEIVSNSDGGTILVPLQGTGVETPVMDTYTNIARVNAGGPNFVDGSGKTWEATTAEFINQGKMLVYENAIPIADTSDDILYQSELFGTFDYRLNVSNGTYRVTLLFAELYYTEEGKRLFDVFIEGNEVLPNFDIFAQVGNGVALQEVFEVPVNDGELTIEFRRIPGKDHAKLSALSIDKRENVAPQLIPVARVNAGGLPYTDTEGGEWSATSGLADLGKLKQFEVASAIAGTEDDPLYQTEMFGEFAYTQTVENGDYIITLHFAELFHTEANMRVFDVTLEGNTVLPNFDIVDEVGFLTAVTKTFPVQITDGSIDLTFIPTEGDAKISAIEVQKVSLNGELPIKFTQRVIVNSQIPGAQNFENPTTVQLGPDGRLYVGQVNGLIHIFTLDAELNVTDVEVVTAIFDSPTFNDETASGTCPAAVGRQITGLFVDETGTIYTAHSDPRIGFNTSSTALCIDTDGGVLTKLNGPDYNNPNNRTDLVTGLARSRENHAPNGILIDEDGWLYLSVGGNTNYGAPSTFFSHIPESNGAAVILRLNLNAAFSAPYDASAASSVTSVAGDGELPGVFEVYADGYRNGYDILKHSNGKLYVNVNEGNNGLGNTPGPADGCPNGVSLNPGTLNDKLFIVTQGAYGGHPHPARGKCVFGDGSIYTPALTPEASYTPPIHEYIGSISTNGLAEFASNAFAGQMLGNLITVSTFANNQVRSLRLSPDGNSVVEERIIGSALAGPIDVWVHPNGTIFVAEFGSESGSGGDTITILEPDVSGTVGDSDGDSIPDAIDPDDDNDLYSDIDEALNGTDPFNPASFPPDFDKDFISDILDDDDDNDSILDSEDQFIFDPLNGSSTVPPLRFEYNPGDAFLGNLRNTGFTGTVLSSNGEGFISNRLNAGAAGGFISINPTTGDMRGASNDQDNALQLGIDARSAEGVGEFTAYTRVVDPFVSPPAPPQGAESAGLFFAIDEDNFVQLVVSGDTGAGVSGIQFNAEIGGVHTQNVAPAASLPLGTAQNIDLALRINPDTLTIEAFYKVDSEDSTDYISLGSVNATTFSGLETLFTQSSGIGIAATRAGEAASSFVAVLDYFRLLAGPPKPSFAADAKALVVIDPGLNINTSSTFVPDSLQVTNLSTGGVRIDRVRIDLRPALLPDQMWDPFGTAGDPVGKPFTPDSGEVTTGFSSAAYFASRDEGFEVLDARFSDFDTNETFTASVDADPTSIKGANDPGPSHSGSLSGLEMSGAEVTVFFSDGSVHSNSLYAISNSDTGAQSFIGAGQAEAPDIQTLGSALKQRVVTNSNQSILITGPASTNFRLLLVEGALFLSGVPNGGFDIDPFEANKVVQIIGEFTGVTDANGNASVSVTLEDTLSEGGLNHLIAVFENANGETGRTSEKLVLDLQ